MSILKKIWHFFRLPTINPLEHDCFWKIGDKIEIYFTRFYSTDMGVLSDITSDGITILINRRFIHFKVMEPLVSNLSAVRGGGELLLNPVAGINNRTIVLDSDRKCNVDGSLKYRPVP